MNFLNRRKKKKPMKIKSVMEHPLNEANFAYKKNRDEKSPQIEKSIDTSSEMEKRNNTLPIKKRKLIRDLLLLSDEMEPTNEELKYRESEMKSPNALLKSKQFLKCTKCNKNYEKTISKNQKISVHPFLGVLMCKSCCEYYGDGNFSLDSDDEDKYCRWCGEGGKIFSCSKCIYGFCSVCIKKHFGIKYLKDILKDDDWLCFFCNPKPLWYLRFVCSLAEMKSQVSETSSEKDKPKQIQKIQGKRKPDESEKDELEVITRSPITSKTKRRRILFQSDNEESDEDHFNETKEKLNFVVDQSNKKESDSSKKPPGVEKLERILKLLEYHLSFGCNWTKKLMLRLNSSNSSVTDSDFLKECQKTKWFLSLMSSHLLEFCRTVESLEETSPKNSPTKTKDNDSIIGGDDPSKCGNLTSYSDILIFLGFVSKQVKTFMDKGISVQDLVDADIVDDEEVLGIKKKNSPSKSSEKTSGDNSEKNDPGAGPSNASPAKVAVNYKKVNISESGTPGETSENESDEAMMSIEIESTQAERKGKAKTLNKESNGTAKEKRNAKQTADNYEEILAILEDS